MADEAGSPDVVQIAAADTGWFGKNRAGVLRVAGERVSFTTGDTTEFDVPIAELRSGKFAAADSVFKVAVNGRKYRFYFGTRVADLPGIYDTASVTQGARGFVESKNAGRALKELIGL